jgi:hypothetical protein
MERRRNYYKRSLDYVATKYKEVDLAYMAGIIDGEGCFFIGTVPKKDGDGYISQHYRGLLKVDNTDIRLIEWIDITFSGTSSSNTKWTSTRRFERKIFSWIATGDRLLDIAEHILPYLVIKKEQCEIMIEFRKTYTQRLGSTKVSKENLDIRQQCLEKIRKHNSRYHLHPLKGNL